MGERKLIERSFLSPKPSFFQELLHIFLLKVQKRRIYLIESAFWKGMGNLLARQKVSHFLLACIDITCCEKIKNVCMKLLEMKLAFSQSEKAEEGAYAPSSFFSRALILSKILLQMTQYLSHTFRLAISLPNKLQSTVSPHLQKILKLYFTCTYLNSDKNDVSSNYINNRRR